MDAIAAARKLIVRRSCRFGENAPIALVPTEKTFRALIYFLNSINVATNIYHRVSSGTGHNSLSNLVDY